MSSAKNTYADGSESDLLNFFVKPESKLQKEIDHILANSPSWAIRYHLSPERKNILSWYNFKPKSSVLEIGAGCGAVTGTLLDKGLKVTALELEKDRAEVIRRRYADKKNLKIVSDSIYDYSKKQKFDYITLIGVWEYSARYFNKTETNHYLPYIEMLTKIKTFLKPKGVLIIAIENKLGMKYISGCLEDHYDKLFQGIYNYPDYHGVQTFTKPMATSLITKAGYKNIEFYYPFPDYKLPNQIFSEEYLLQLKNTSAIFPTSDPTNKRVHTIDETLLSNTLIEGDMKLNSFANSFLIFAS